MSNKLGYRYDHASDLMVHSQRSQGAYISETQLMMGFGPAEENHHQYSDDEFLGDCHHQNMVGVGVYQGVDYDENSDDDPDDEGYVAFDLPLSELDEWMDFHSQWEEKATPRCANNHGRVVWHAPTDTVLPEDEVMLKELTKEVEVDRTDKQGGKGTWDSKKERRTSKEKQMHKGHQPRQQRGPIRHLDPDQLQRALAAFNKKKARREKLAAEKGE